MSNVFEDQRRFMEACGQSTDRSNPEQYDTSPDQYEMYISLIEEEVDELFVAKSKLDRVEQLDALIDILVVTVGAIHSMGADGEGAWNEVMRTNFAKIDPVTGKVRKREDGKVLKPEGWTAPELSKFL